VLDHGGAWQGFEARISRCADNTLTVVVLCNLDAFFRAEKAGMEQEVTLKALII
jgi:hypothetical protein